MVQPAEESSDLSGAASNGLKESQSPQLTREIERRWLVKELPRLSGIPAVDIRQGYIAVDPNGNEVRVRKEGDLYYLTAKGPGGLERYESPPKYLTAEEFANYLPLTQGREIEKVRYKISFGDATIELNIYGGLHAGFCKVEVEFPSARESALFNPPSWFGREVTEDPAYNDKNIALHGLPADYLKTTAD